MSLLMYAITDQETSELRCIGEGPLTAVIAEQAGAGESVLWRYERVLERLMRDHALLPARFGSVFADKDSIRAMLRDRRAELLAALDRVRGAVELGLRVSWRDAPPLARPESGTEYMRSRLELHRRAAAVARAFEPLTALARSSDVRVLPNARVPVAGAYLLDSSRVEAFAALVARFDGEIAEVDTVCTGPWPPYSFVGAVADER